MCSQFSAFDSEYVILFFLPEGHKYLWFHIYMFLALLCSLIALFVFCF